MIAATTIETRRHVGAADGDVPRRRKQAVSARKVISSRAKLAGPSSRSTHSTGRSAAIASSANTRPPTATDGGLDRGAVCCRRRCRSGTDEDVRVELGATLSDTCFGLRSAAPSLVVNATCRSSPWKVLPRLSIRLAGERDVEDTVVSRVRLADHLLPLESWTATFTVRHGGRRLLAWSSRQPGCGWCCCLRGSGFY